MAVSSDPIADAARAVIDGELVVFPTDTVYGIAADPAIPTATQGIFRAKRRDRGLTLPVLAPTVQAARAVARFDERAETLAERLWPGALTLVLPRTPESLGWGLGGDDDTVGVRVPDHRLARALLDISGPLAVTSANRSGEPPATTCEELHEAFGDLVAVYLCEAAPLQGAASTVLDLAHGPARVLREGDVEPATIARLLPAREALLDSRPSS